MHFGNKNNISPHFLLKMVCYLSFLRPSFKLWMPLYLDAKQQIRAAHRAARICFDGFIFYSAWVLFDEQFRLEPYPRTELYCEGAQTGTTHAGAGVLRCLTWGNQLCTFDSALCSCLVEQVHNIAAEGQLVTDFPFHAGEGFPMPLEVECLLDVGIGLPKVTEAHP